MRGFLKEFREFAVKGNVVDMAVGIVIGGAFGTIVKSFVSDVIMPPIGLLIGHVQFSSLFWVIAEGKPRGPYATIAEAHKAGAVTLNYGTFIDNIVSFLIIAWAVFLLVRVINRIRREFEAPEAPAEPTTKECPYCASTIPLKATRCPNCTSELGQA
ncbi:MAG TPA: large-conductance mechanosensitive channel protein MscL [Gammaproteobacteria bacterium]|nr:large-conductance mechanosensitive channel protein MscL [Gammaproteobacteria bacterium]